MELFYENGDKMFRVKRRFHDLFFFFFQVSLRKNANSVRMQFCDSNKPITRTLMKTLTKKMRKTWMIQVMVRTILFFFTGYLFSDHIYFFTYKIWHENQQGQQTLLSKAWLASYFELPHSATATCAQLLVWWLQPQLYFVGI